MEDAFTRRGFGRVLALGAAGLLLPSVSRAQPAALRPRLVLLEVSDIARAALYLTATGERGLELLTGAARLVGQVVVRGEAHPMTLEPELEWIATRSRAGRRLRRRVLLPRDQEVRYDSFAAGWPDGLTSERVRGGELRLAVQPLGDDADTAALRGLTVLARIA